MTGLLDGGLASAFAAAFGATFLDALLYRPPAPFTDDGMGGGSGGQGGFVDPPEAVKAQLDQATTAMQASDDFVDSDQRILVLASGVEPITTDCEISVAGVRWSIASVTQDPAKAYYELRGRKKANA
jgi:hypothetical protein